MRRAGILLLLTIFFTPGNFVLSQDFDSDIQQGCDTLTVNFTYTSTDVTATSIEWDFGNGETSTELFPAPVFYNSPGKYTVSIVVNSTLLKSKTDYIEIYPNPTASFTWTDTIVSGDFDIALYASDQNNDSISYTYSWVLPQQTLTGRNVVAAFTSGGAYNVELLVEDPYGCNASVTRQVLVEGEDLVPEEEILIIPNVFTPNNDGQNDLFIVPTDGTSIYSFHVFSRAGVEIYRSNAPSIVWDGYTSSGIEASPGIYYYAIESEVADDGLSKAGFFYLFR